MSMNKKPQRKQFTFKKVKLITDGGLICDHIIEIVIGDETHHISSNPTFTFNPRPILHEHLNNMKIVVAEVLNFKKFVTLVGTKEFLASPLQKEMTARTMKTITDQINITGISVSGEGAKEGVCITYGLKAHNGQVIGGATPKLYFSVSTHGFEQDLEKDVEAIKDEMYEYIVNNKYAEIQMGLGNVPSKKEAGGLDFKEDGPEIKEKGDVVDAKVIKENKK